MSAPCGSAPCESGSDDGDGSGEASLLERYCRTPWGMNRFQAASYSTAATFFRAQAEQPGADGFARDAAPRASRAPLRHK